MSSLNKVFLMGRLGKDPEIRNLSSTKQVANFSLATSTSWLDRESGEKKESTEWHNIVVYKDSLINVIQKYIKKGSLIYIEGSLKTRKWVDKDNNNRYTTEVVLNNNGEIRMIDTRGDFDKNSSKDYVDENKTQNNQVIEKIDITNIDDEIPF